MKSLKILTTNTCGRCKAVKPNLRDKCERYGIAYTELTIPDIEAVALANKYSVAAVPFIEYQDGESIQTFDTVFESADVDNLFKDLGFTG